MIVASNVGKLARVACTVTTWTATREVSAVGPKLRVIVAAVS